MGARLSVSQKGVYYQVVAMLEGGGIWFSKKQLKEFIR